MSVDPWNNWFHICGNTYGTWVRGDPRGWRARHHREHVEGDYKNPPPKGKYDGELRGSLNSMKKDRVELNHEQQKFLLPIFGNTLHKNGAEVVDLCIGKKHFHTLVRFDLPHVRRDWNKPRVVVGRAKGASAFALGRAGLIAPGGVWGTRCKVKPIANEHHFLRVAKYIVDHAKQGAVVLSIEAQLNPSLRLLLSDVTQG